MPSCVFNEGEKRACVGVDYVVVGIHLYNIRRASWCEVVDVLLQRQP